MPAVRPSAHGLAPLSIDAVLPDLVSALRREKAAVLKAPPGAGKSTRVPGALVDAGLTDGLVVMLEPRRVAARATARRIAEERRARLGGEVGYQVRFEERRSEKTRILVVTEGILTRRFARDPFLEGIGVVVLDEFHERSLHTDLCLAFVRELLEVRDDLRLVVMSATLETGPLAAYLGGCPVVTCETRAHPLDVRHAERPDDRPLEVRVRAALRELLREERDDGGDVLVFLPGAPEIRRAERALEEGGLPGDVEVVPLFGALSPEEQDRALVKGRRRRVVLATNIAETSLTLPGVTAVVDTGLQKALRQDPRTGIDRLELGRISKESAEQRAGRAGRLAPGRVVRLWTRAEHALLPERDEPEICRIDLASALLSVLAFHPGDPRAFPFFARPPEASLARALSLLEALDAVHDDEGILRLTPRGERLLALPAHPRTGALLLRAAEEGCLEEAALAAALLGERDVLRQEAALDEAGEAVSSDLWVRASLVEALAEQGFSRRAADVLGLDVGAARRVWDAKRQLAALVRGGRKAPPDDLERALARSVLAGFPDRVCRRSAPGSAEGRMVGGRGVELAPSSRVREGMLFVAVLVEEGRGARSRVLWAVEVEEADLEAVYPEHLSEEERAFFDEERKAAVGARVRRYLDLVLDERRGIPVAPEVLSRVLAKEAARRPQDALALDDKARRLLLRLRFATRALPEEGWPDVSDERLRALLLERCEARRSFDELRRIDWHAELSALLSWPLQRLLDAEVPDRVEVPSGSRIAIDYEPAFGPEQAPVLAVRLQEVFGLLETPRIAKGRVPLLLHLLAPSGRPMQVTRDLQSFWEGAYAEVRKELRRRYPKHAWPDDPKTARPEARPKRKNAR